jgi:dTDP-4-amino-4,6-dideoxygalactose transaminase
MALVRQVISTGNLAYIYGTKVRQFEEQFAGIFGLKNAVAVSSGTAALHTAMIYLNPDPGDEILVSPITDMGSVIPILYQQAVPVFVDIDPFNQNMDPAAIEQQISLRTRAIMVTHIFGSPADMDPIVAIARKHNLFVIEDCAQAHMTEYHGRKVGTIGNIGCFSFQQSKHITTGDGGMVISDEDERFGRSLRLCFDKGWPRAKPGRDHYFLAPNYHMTELQAAVGLAQIRKYDQSIQARRDAAAQLDKLLEPEEAIAPVGTLSGCKQTYFYYCFRVDVAKLKVDLAAIIEALKAEGLFCEQGYPGPIPLYLYPLIKEHKTFGTSGWPFTAPAARKRWEYPQGLCPKAEKACQETVILPWNEGLRSLHVALIAEAIRKVVGFYKK